MTDPAEQETPAQPPEALVEPSPPPVHPPLTLARFRQLEADLRARGYGDTISWSEAVKPPTTARMFAREAIYVICNSGMSNVIANAIFNRCMAALRQHQPAASVFKHPEKARAIDFIWTNRRALFAAYRLAEDKLAHCATLPYIGPVTSYHLAKNFGADVAKPDVHLVRLAQAEGSTVVELCERLAAQSGYRVTAIDTILWRACADGLLDSAVYLIGGWEAAYAAP